MEELELLKKLWQPRRKRSLQLVVPKVTYEQTDGSLNNDQWAYRVTYAFRDALDLKYQERKKDKKCYMVWTQGPLIAFKEGDTIISQCQRKAVQVKFANPMGWDSEKNEMYQGRIMYVAFDVDEQQFSKSGEYECSQMEFLGLLIRGESCSG